MDLYTVEPCMEATDSLWNFPTLFHSDNRWLNHKVSEYEIKEAVFQMRSQKGFTKDIGTLLGNHVLSWCLRFSAVGF